MDCGVRWFFSPFGQVLKGDLGSVLFSTKVRRDRRVLHVRQNTLGVFIFKCLYSLSVISVLAKILLAYSETNSYKENHYKIVVLLLYA